MVFEKFKLFEAALKKDDANEILAVINDSEEGKDLIALLTWEYKAPGRPLLIRPPTFEAKASGRVWVSSSLPLSKTYIRKSGDYWEFSSLSNGVPFVTESADNIEEVIRLLWASVISRSPSSGVTKKEMGEWALSPPSGLYGKEYLLDTIKKKNPNALELIDDPLVFVDSDIWRNFSKNTGIPIEEENGIVKIGEISPEGFSAKAFNNITFHGIKEIDDGFNKASLFAKISSIPAALLSTPGDRGARKFSITAEDKYSTYIIPRKILIAQGDPDTGRKKFLSFYKKKIKNFDHLASSTVQYAEPIKYIVDALEGKPISGSFQDIVKKIQAPGFIEVANEVPSILPQMPKEIQDIMQKTHPDLPLDYIKSLLEYILYLKRLVHGNKEKYDFIPRIDEIITEVSKLLKNYNRQDIQSIFIANNMLESILDFNKENANKFSNLMIEEKAIQKMIDDEPGRMVMVLSHVWKTLKKNPKYSGLKFPPKYEENIGTISDLSDLGL